MIFSEKVGGIEIWTTLYIMDSFLSSLWKVHVSTFKSLGNYVLLTISSWGTKKAQYITIGKDMSHMNLTLVATCHSQWLDFVSLFFSSFIFCKNWQSDQAKALIHGHPTPTPAWKEVCSSLPPKSLNDSWRAIFIEQNMRSELVLGRLAVLNISDWALKYATFGGLFYVLIDKFLKIL